MTAISLYAPIRRQSSILSNVGGGSVLRRSSSSVTTVWLISRIISNYSNDDGKSNIHSYLNRIADIVYSSLSIDNSVTDMNSGDKTTGGELSKSSSSRHHRIASVLNWLVCIVGGNQSRIGRIIISAIRFVREALLRSIGAANLLLTGGIPSSYHNLKDEQLCAQNLMNGNHHNEITRSKLDIETIQQDLQLIDQVLSYWFGKASPDGAQKSLWMIASSSVELLDKVDADISQRFRSLILSLSSSWLKGESLDDDMLSRWTDNVEIYGWQGKMAAIIALDQMSRHIHRHDKKNCDDKTIQHIPKQQKLDSIAYNVAKKMLEDHKKELSSGMIPIPMRIFGIMPLRHASTVQDLAIVQKDVESASALHDEMDRMIRRFRKATNRRMAALQDEARREGKLGLLDTGDSKMNGDSNIESKQFDDEKILECFPFKADMSKALNHTVTKTISSFLSKMNILQLSDDRQKSSRKTAKQSSPDDTSSSDKKVPTAIVSLSGGVDSMVIASALAYLRDTEATRRQIEPENILHIVAIHIDYANRPESGAEAAYVGRYCEELGAKFICRKIDEVKRGVTQRDDYERIAREIRFDLYRECSAQASNGTSIGIMLGHHRGDLRENVISNSHKGCGPLDLSGMTAVSKNDGVNLFRPLLTLEKTHIYDYSHTFGVPYFKDTTPHWSTRGKLRNRLLPLLEEIYGEGSMDHLSSLAEESDDAKALVQQTVLEPFMKQVKRYPMGIAFDTASWKDNGLFFWKFVLRQVLHSAGFGMFSDKSVESFLDRVGAEKVREGWLQCRKDYAVFLQQDGRVFVFYPKSFPFGNGRKNAQYDGEEQAFGGYGTENSIQIGPWTISSVIIKASEKEETLLQTKAFTNMEELLAGKVEYLMKVPLINGKSPCPLVRVNGYTKSTRPKSWKGVDLKVESTLPLLGVDHSVLENETVSDCDDTWALVKVQLVLQDNSSLESLEILSRELDSLKIDKIEYN